jgi:hypothetical protein
MQLAKSEKFLKEYESFHNKIEMIPDIKVKAELNELLLNLVRSVKEIDNKHQEMMSGSKLPMGVEDIRNEIYQTRQKLQKKLDHAARAGMIK